MSDSASSPTQPASGLPADPYIGQVIGERYRLLQRIGEGGMGAVYRAEHMLMKKAFALKLLHRELGQVGEAARRFEREAQSASRLSHPNTVAVTDFGRAATGELYLAMEHVPGHSLASVIERGPLPVPRALGIVRQMLSALAHAHASGVVHRDLKPANVMLTRSPDGTSDDNVKILDFGIAKLTQDLAEGERPLTQAAMVFGTPSYMSPEQATAQEVDARADLYSCGVILYELLTGRKPFVASDLVKIMALQVTTPPPRFATAAPDVRIPAALEDAVMRALEKDRTRRYQSAAEMIKALEGLETAVVPQALAAEAVSRARTAVLRARPIVASLVAELVAAYRRLPWKLRRWSPVAGVLLVVLMLVAVPSICSGPVAPVAKAPPPPKPVVPVLQEPLRKIEEAMARARLTEARVMLLQLLSKHPQEGRVHYLLGNLEFVDRKPSAALAAYDEALRLDPGLRGDAALLVNVRSLLEDRDRKVAWDALMLMTERIGAPAADDLVEMANEDRRPEFRAAAREACASINCGKKLDLVRSYTLDLSAAKTCDEKREAVRGLASTKDARAIEPLKKARGVRGMLGGLLGGGNDCVRKEIDAALKELGA